MCTASLARNPSGLHLPLLPGYRVLLFAKLGTLGTDKRQLLTFKQQLKAIKRHCLFLRSRSTQTWAQSGAQMSTQPESKSLLRT